MRKIVINAIVAAFLTLSQAHGQSVPDSPQATITPKSSQSQLDAAIEALDPQAFEEAIRLGADPAARGGPANDTVVFRVLGRLDLMKWHRKETKLEPAEVDVRVSRMVKAVFASGFKEEKDASLLIIPALENAAETAKTLLDLGANPEHRAGSGEKPLYVAIFWRSADVERLFLSRGANPLSKKEEMQARLTGAAFAGDLTAVRKLLDDGADPSNADVVGTTPLFSSITIPRPEIAKLLLARGANPNGVSKALLSRRAFPLTEAVSASVRNHLQHDPESVNEDGFAVVKALLEHHADVSLSNPDDGRTPLHIACERGILPVVRLLLNAGAKVMPRDARGKTSLDYATSGPVIKLLKEYGAVEK